MADEVQINNVGGEGVASDITLQRLVAVTEEMAKKAGIDPKDVTKKLTALSKATGDTIQVSTKHRDGLKKNTKAVKDSTSAFKKIGGVVGGTLLSSFMGIARSGTEMTKAFISGQKSLTAFAGHLPIIGGSLSILTGLFDDSFSAFQSVATSGAAFNNSLTDLRNSAANSRMALDDFVGFISNNTDKLAAFGGTATQGAKMVSALTNSNKSMRLSMLNMGFTFEEINEAMLDFSYLTRAGNRGKKLEGDQLRAQAQSAGDYAKHLNTLAKLTGKEAKAMEAEIQQKMQDVAFQRKLATMGADEQAKVQMAMQQAMAAGGQSAVDALTAEFLGMPPVTEEARLYTATMGTQMGILTSNLKTAQDESVKISDMSTRILTSNVDLMEANKNSATEFGTLLDAAAVGLGGSADTISGFFNDASLKYTDYLTKTGELDTARALQVAKDAEAESKKREDNTASMAAFTESLATLQTAFQTNIVIPLMDAVGPALRELTTLISGVEYDDEGNAIEKKDENGNIIEAENGFASAIAQVGAYITNDLAPSIEKFIEAFKEDPKKAISDLFDRGVSGLSNVIKDFFLGKKNDGMDKGEREGGFLEKTLYPIIKDFGSTLVNGLIDGVKSMWEADPVKTALIAAIGAFFLAPGATLALASGVTSLMAAGVKKMGSYAFPKKPPVAPKGPTVGRDPKTGKFTKLPTAPKGGMIKNAGKLAMRGAKFIPGVGLIAAGAMGLFDGVSGFNADKDAGLGEKLGNAGSSLLNGLSFGLLGSSPEEIAAEAAEKGDTAASPTSGPNMNTPGAQLALVLSKEQIATMERVAKINLDNFNSSLQTLLDIDLRKISTLQRLDISGFAQGFKTFAEIPDFSTNFDTLKELDATSIRSYTSAMEDLVETLGKLNEELSRDNDTLFSSRADAGELLSGISASTSGSNTNSEQLNNTMKLVYDVLLKIQEAEETTAKNTGGITFANLARGGVSNVGN